jgi:hypothetical protein
MRFGSLGVAFVVVALAVMAGCWQGGPAPGPGGEIQSGDDGGDSSSDDDAASAPSFADGGRSLRSDGGQPDAARTADGGSPPPAADGGLRLCNPLDPKYATEFLQAAASGLPTPCDSCTGGECCYDLLGCVPE